MSLHDYLIILLGYASEVLGTLSGFGSSTFFVPIALLFESFQFVLALTALLHCFGNIFKIILFRGHFELKTFLLLFPPFVILTGAGALLTTHLSNVSLQRALGVALVAFALFALFGKKELPRSPRWVAVVLTGLSGFSTGLIGTGGAIRGVALTAIGVPKNSFVALSSSIDMGGDLLRAAIYLKNGFMDWDEWFYIPLLAVAALAGAKTGKLILSRINQIQFEKIVAGCILVSGFLMLF